jgi:hypothetical protein
MIEVINVKDGKANSLVVYVGRKNFYSKAKIHMAGTGKGFLDYSILGNTQSGKGRDERIENYRNWLWKEIQAGEDVWRALVTLARMAMAGDLTLACWCKPQPCHADVIKKCLEWIIETCLRAA